MKPLHSPSSAIASFVGAILNMALELCHDTNYKVIPIYRYTTNEVFYLIVLIPLANFSILPTLKSV